MGKWDEDWVVEEYGAWNCRGIINAVMHSSSVSPLMKRGFVFEDREEFALLETQCALFCVENMVVNGILTSAIHCSRPQGPFVLPGLFDVIMDLVKYRTKVMMSIVTLAEENILLTIASLDF